MTYMEDEEDFDIDIDDEEDEEDTEDEAPVVPEYQVDLTFDQIVAADDITEQHVYIPEWEGYVTVRSLSTHEMNQMRKQARVKGVERQDIIQREMVVMGVVRPVITREKYNVLMGKSASALIKIIESIQKVSRLEDESREKSEKRFPRR